MERNGEAGHWKVDSSKQESESGSGSGQEEETI